MNKEIIILTSLPFRKYGNQSIKRFVNMFLKKGFNVILFSSGSDSKGENVIDNSNFKKYRLPSLFEAAINLKMNFKLPFYKKSKNKTPTHNDNLYKNIRSDTVLPPFKSNNVFNLIKAWIRFILMRIDNLFATIYLMLFKKKHIVNADAIIAYEIGYTFAGKLLSRIYKKKYINKFQGVILKSTNRDINLCIKHYPENYFGLNKADLCIMVNDGTDGLYYAKIRGNSNIYFETHGVNNKEYDHLNEEQLEIGNFINNVNSDHKFIIFNNASASRWKRVDRIIRGLSLLDKGDHDKILFLTTYYGHDRHQLKELATSLGVNDIVLFLDNINHIQSNAILRISDVLAMTNDMSNLGNPVLEAIYYGVPIVTINDGSMEGFIKNGIDGYLIDLNDDFDITFAKIISNLINNRELYNSLKNNIKDNKSVNNLETQQIKEFETILNAISLK